MKFGIIQNVAGNVDALADADLQFEQFRVDAKVCLGQIAGVYPFVDECVEFLLTNKYVTLRTRFDDGFRDLCAGISSLEGWSATNLVDAFRFAKAMVSHSTLSFMNGLPTNSMVGAIAFESRSDVRGGFIYSPEEAEIAFAEWKQPIVFHAANLEPFVWYEDLRGEQLKSGANILRTGSRMLISPGGVGSRSHGSRKLPCAIVFDDAEGTVHVLHPVCDSIALRGRLRQVRYPEHLLKCLDGFEYELWKSHA